MKEQNYSKALDKNKVLSPNEKLKEMQAFINSLQSKKEAPTETTKTKGNILLYLPPDDNIQAIKLNRYCCRRNTSDWLS